MDVPNHVTVEDIAHSLGLSQTTVSLVLAGRAKRHRISTATAQRVLDAAREMHYHPNPVARQLAGKRSNVIGVLISTEAIADVRLIQTMEMIAAQRGIRFMVGHAVGPPEQVKAYLEDFRARGVDAVLSIFHNHPDYSRLVLPELASFEKVVCFEKASDTHHDILPEACYVQPDYYEAGRMGVQHLIDRGRKRIGLVFSNLIFPYAVQRRRAYDDVMKTAGRSPEESLVWVFDQRTRQGWAEPFTLEAALQAVDDLVIGQKVDGIVAVNDLYAARLVQALRKRGRRIPDDVALVGCDNLDIGTLTDPTLTTIELHSEELCRAMMDYLFALLDGVPPSPENRGRVLKPDLIVREST